METSLVLHVPARPILVASRLRVAMEQRGFVALPPKIEAPLDGFTLAVRSEGPAACWVHPDHPDAVPDELGRLLSDQLRCRVTTIARMDPICAYEAAEGGRVVEKLAARGAEVLEDVSSPYADAVRGGAALEDRLADAGLDGFRMAFDQARTARRAMVLGFAPRPGGARSTDAVIEIDPGLSCPQCGGPMRVMDGKFDRFFGCVQFPACRGRLTQKQAEKVRRT